MKVWIGRPFCGWENGDVRVGGIQKGTWFDSWLHLPSRIQGTNITYPIHEMAVGKMSFFGFPVVGFGLVPWRVDLLESFDWPCLLHSWYLNEAEDLQKVY